MASDEQPDHEPIIQSFRQWFENNGVPGTVGQTETVNTTFMPRQRLDAWLKEGNNTSSLLQALWPDGAPVSKNEIWGKCSRGFAILLLIGKGHFIQHFVQHDSLWDNTLPFDTRPSKFPTASDDPDFFARFAECQWQFFPYTFWLDAIDVELYPKRILPIKNKKLFEKGGFADIYEVQLHQHYDKLTRTEDPTHVSIAVLPHFVTDNLDI